MASWLFFIPTLVGLPAIADTRSLMKINSVSCSQEMIAGSDLASVRKTKRCEDFHFEPKCESVAGRPIPYFEKEGSGKTPARILVFGQIHGDETDAGALAEKWIERLRQLPSSSNFWRVIPLLNPDGAHAKSRANANGVDLNRNFPTTDWKQMALLTWSDRLGKDPRRFPGSSPGSEPETRCAIEQIESFKPDIVVSIHTPYGLLDFDGPKTKFPEFKALPWSPLGQFPGSLGRYLWVDRKIPVLTIELGSQSLKTKAAEFDRLQDLVSLLLKPQTIRSTASAGSLDPASR